MTTIDIVIPTYNENPDALAATLLACLKQSISASHIFVIDDGSSQPTVIPNTCNDRRIHLIHLSNNLGIAAARNIAVLKSSAEFIACINVEVLPQFDWLQVCADYLKNQPQVGACFTQLVPHKADILSQWRMKFHEQPYSGISRPASFAPGHAVLFRRESILAVNGYREKFRRIGEDYDICVRMQEQGWETHYTVGSRCVSIQEDSWIELAKKQIGRQGIELGQGCSVPVFLSKALISLGHRLGRNLLKGRLKFIAVDFMIFFGSVWVFAQSSQKLRQRWLMLFLLVFLA